MAQDFRCHRCGECCRWPGYVIIEKPDIAALARTLSLSESEFIDKYARLTENRGRLSLIEKPDGSCIFLENNSCSVYLARPKQCRDFPKYWTVDGGCPGLEEID